MESKLQEVLSQMNASAPSKIEDIYASKDPVVRLDDGSFIRHRKIRPLYWKGPGIIQVYAPWCPHCQSKVNSMNILADKLRDNNQAVYVLDGTDNPHFRYAHGVNAYPTVLKVLEDATIGEVIDGDLPQIAEYLASLL
jgi:thiol-disulfide isomerase/thioredoxin